ncbi:MAG: glycosyltransferase, partial [Bacteroidetes bacterium]|nr:glycosyltransferase [Bacteroidota bacterium]
TSMHTKLALDKYYPNFLGKKSVVYQPIHPDFYAVQHTTSPKKPTFLSVEAGSTNYFVYQSSFTERKNHLALVEAFSLIQKQIDWNLILVGIDGPMRLQIEQQIAALHLEKRIRIIVDAHHSLLLTIVLGASGFVYPSMSEGFGIPLAEAAVAGLPMAVSRIPIFIEIAEDTPVYFHPNKIEEMAAAMMQISLPEEQVRQRQKVGAILDKIDSKTIANNLMQAYLNPS